MFIYRFSLSNKYTCFFFFFFFNDTATTEIYTLSLHDALPISASSSGRRVSRSGARADPTPSANVTQHTTDTRTLTIGLLRERGTTERGRALRGEGRVGEGGAGEHDAAAERDWRGRHGRSGRRCVRRTDRAVDAAGGRRVEVDRRQRQCHQVRALDVVAWLDRVDRLHGPAGRDREVGAVDVEDLEEEEREDERNARQIHGEREGGAAREPRPSQHRPDYPTPHRGAAMIVKDHAESRRSAAAARRRTGAPRAS